MTFAILGFDNNYKVPRFAAQILYGAGTVTAAQSQLTCLLAGLKTSAGSMTANQDVVAVQTAEEADAAAGPGSQLARMAYKALRVPGVKVELAAITEPAGNAATATLLLGGTWTVAGQWRIRIAGEVLSGLVGATASVSDVGNAIVAAVTARPRLPVSAAFNTATVTFTCKNTHLQSNDWIIAWDNSLVPSGMTHTLTGSAAAGSDRVYMGVSAGAGVEDPTTMLTYLNSRRYGRVAVGSNDATNATTKWKAWADAKSVSTTMLYEHLVFAVNGSAATAKTLAQGTLSTTYSGGLDHVRSMVLWARKCESHPAEIAAAMAAYRAAVEAADPVPDYDGLPLSGISGVFPGYESDIPTDTEQNDALNAGVTPVTYIGSEARVVRAITTKCLTAAGYAGETRTLDIGDAVFPDYAAIDSALLYADYKAQNKYVQADAPADGEPLPSGVGSPKLWNDHLMHRMKDWFKSGWIEDPAANPPVSTFNSVAKRIETTLPLLVRRVQHQLGMVVRQTSNS